MSSHNNGQHHAAEVTIERNGSSASGGRTGKNGNGRKALIDTIPLVESQEGASTEARDTMKAKSGAARPRPRATGEASTTDAVDDAVTSAAVEAVQRIRGKVGPPKLDWPVEAQRRPERLKLKQTLAVDLLASGMTVSEAARQLGIDRSTVHRWLNDPVFLSELEDRRQELLDSMLDQHLLAGRMATAKLMELMESSEEGIALRAAIELYRGAQRAYQSIDVRSRIERLENNLAIIYSWRR